MSIVRVVIMLMIVVIVMAVLDVADTVISYVKGIMSQRLGINFNILNVSPYTMAYVILSLIATVAVLFVVFRIANAIRSAGGGQ